MANTLLKTINCWREISNKQLVMMAPLTSNEIWSKNLY